MKKYLFIALTAILAFGHVGWAQDPLDFGDAPEGVIAYPATGLIGSFPTCITTGPGSWIQHGLGWALFGPYPPQPPPLPPGTGWDAEIDGNAGSCPVFNPNAYDMDECYQDMDAGLMFPEPFTLQGAPGAEVVTVCPGWRGTSLGVVCRMAVWGTNIDIWITNTRPDIGYYVNVLMDWDQNGVWGGAVPCPSAPSPEHVLVNWPVPAGYIGALSALQPPPFQIGALGGHVWTRFSITEVPVSPPWDGSGAFEDGETEDYLLLVSEVDFGDAPDPSYPTLASNNGAQHAIVPGFFMGVNVDGDLDGQPDANATGDDILDGNDDEDGVVIQNLYAGNPAATAQVTVSAPGFIDAWIDFNGNGSWADAGEQILISQPVLAGLNNLPFAVPGSAAVGNGFARFRFSAQGGLNFTGFATDGEVEDYLLDILVPVELSSFTAHSLNGTARLEWTTQSETENLGFHLYRAQAKDDPYQQITPELIAGAGTTQRAHHYAFADLDVMPEITYYYKLADISYSGIVRMHGPVPVHIAAPSQYRLGQNYPNPFNPATTIPFTLAQSGQVTLTIFNLQGQCVCELFSGTLDAGPHQITWDGRDAQGVVPSGVYLYVLRAADFYAVKKMNFVR